MSGAGWSAFAVEQLLIIEGLISDDASFGTSARRILRSLRSKIAAEEAAAAPAIGAEAARAQLEAAPERQAIDLPMPGEGR